MIYKKGEVMSKEDVLEVNGQVIDVLPGTKFKVRLENNMEIIAYLAGKMRNHKIRIIDGDSVVVEMSPYDLTKGRIIWRNK